MTTEEMRDQVIEASRALNQCVVALSDASVLKVSRESADDIIMEIVLDVCLAVDLLEENERAIANPPEV